MNTCEYRKNIDCLYSGAVIFCQNCGYYPPEEKWRKAALNKNVVEIEAERRKNIMQLRIVHNGEKVSYSVQAVRKRTASPKTNSQLKNQQGDG